MNMPATGGSGRNGLPVKPYVWRGNASPRPAPLQEASPAPVSVKARASANAAKTHCGICGAPYDEENTYRTRSGRRVCRACERARKRENARIRAEERSGADLSDPCVAAVVAAMDKVRYHDLTRPEIAALAVAALRDSGWLSQACPSERNAA